MNCLRPHVTVEEEFAHITRNMDFDAVARLKRMAEENAAIDGLSPKELAVIACWKDVS